MLLLQEGFAIHTHWKRSFCLQPTKCNGIGNAWQQQVYKLHASQSLVGHSWFADVCFFVAGSVHTLTWWQEKTQSQLKMKKKHTRVWHVQPPEIAHKLKSQLGVQLSNTANIFLLHLSIKQIQLTLRHCSREGSSCPNHWFATLLQIQRHSWY